MHSGTYPPAGKGKDLKWAKGRPVLRSKVVEPTAIRLLDEGVYTGYSIGIFDPVLYNDPAAPNGRIGKAGPEDTGWIGEVSLVDLPSCPTAVFSLVKRASASAPAELVERLMLAGPDGHRALMTPKRMKQLNKAFDTGGSAGFGATLRKIVAADAKSNPTGVNQYSGGGGGRTEDDQAALSGEDASAPSRSGEPREGGSGAMTGADFKEADKTEEKRMAAEQTGKIAGAAVEAAVTQTLLSKAPHAEGVTCPVCRNGARKLASTCGACRGVGIIPLTLARSIKTVLVSHKDAVKAAAVAELGKDDSDDDVDDAISELMDDLSDLDDAQGDDEDEEPGKPTDAAVDAAITQVGQAISAVAAAQAADQVADIGMSKKGRKNVKTKKDDSFGGDKAPPFGSDDKDGAKDDGATDGKAPPKKKKGKGKKADKQADLHPPDSAGAKPDDAVGEPAQPAPGDTLDATSDNQGATKGKKPGKKQGKLQPAEGTDSIDDNATVERPAPGLTLKPGKKKGKGKGMDCSKCMGKGTVDGDTCSKCGGSGTFGGKKKGKRANKSKILTPTVSPAARRMHDVLCPCYPTEVVKTAYDFSGLPVSDVINPTWFGDRLAMLTSGSVKASSSEVGEAYQAFAAASSVTALTPPAFESLRAAANKTFMDAYPSQGKPPALQDPEAMNRSFLSSANSETGSTTRVPTPDLKPTFGPMDFSRGPLTENEARPTLTGGTSVTGKGKRKGKRAKLNKADDTVPTPVPSRLFYRTADKDDHSSAMALLHDHISQHYPGICPMEPVIPGTEIDSDGLIGQPAERNVEHPGLPSLTSPAAPGTVGTLTPTGTGTANKGAAEAPLTKAEAQEMVRRQVSKLETKHAKRERRLRKRTKAAERRADQALRLPDRSKAPLRGQPFRLVTNDTPEQQLKKSERTKTIEALKVKVADRNPSVAQRARDHLMEIATPEEFAAVVAADED
jgi:hypothetical protein